MDNYPQRRCEKRAQWWPWRKIRNDRRGFETAIKRSVASHHHVAIQVTTRAAVPPPLLDSAYGTSVDFAEEEGVDNLVMHFSTRAYFVFHHRIKKKEGPAGLAMHYGTLPFEALYSGVFFEQVTASAYIAMFGAAITPTSPMVMKANTERLIGLGLKAKRKDNVSRMIRVAIMILLLRGDIGWEEEPGTKMRDRAFIDMIRFTCSPSMWIFNVAQECDILAKLFAGPTALRRTAANAQQLHDHLRHLARRVNDFMITATHRDYAILPLQQMCEGAFKHAIEGCGRDGLSLAALDTMNPAAHAAERALYTAKLLCSVVALTRQQELHMMKPHLALIEAGAFSINLINRSENTAEEEDSLAFALTDYVELAIAHKKKKAKKKKKKTFAQKMSDFGHLLAKAFLDASDTDESDGDDENERKKKEARRKRKMLEKSDGLGLAKLNGIPLVDPRMKEPPLADIDKVWHRVYEVVAPIATLHLDAGERWVRRHRYAPPRMHTPALLLQVRSF
jgi:hypothetical protein